MRHREARWVNGLALMLVLSAALVMQGCMGQAVGNDQHDSEAAAEDPAIPVEAATVINDDVAAVYSGTATLEADEQATVVSQITGVVLEIYAEEGDFVEAGHDIVRQGTTVSSGHVHFDFLTRTRTAQHRGHIRIGQTKAQCHFG